jgi:hypothetical protein
MRFSQTGIRKDQKYNLVSHLLMGALNCFIKPRTVIARGMTQSLALQGIGIAFSLRPLQRHVNYFMLPVVKLGHQEMGKMFPSSSRGDTTLQREQSMRRI